MQEHVNRHLAEQGPNGSFTYLDFCLDTITYNEGNGAVTTTTERPLAPQTGSPAASQRSHR